MTEMFDKSALTDDDVPDGAKAKPTWLLVLDSKAVVALITILLSGFAAQWVSWVLQNKIAEREFNASWLKARGDQALQSHLQAIEQKRNVVEQIAGGMGRVITASRALIASASFDTSNATTAVQVGKIQREFNDAQTAWSAQEYRLGFLLSYYSGGGVATTAAWRDVTRAADAYLECTSTWYDKRRSSSALRSDAICSTQRDTLVDTLTRLSVDSHVTTESKGWDNPDRLKEALGIATHSGHDK